MIVLDYNLLYKIGKTEYILLWMNKQKVWQEMECLYSCKIIINYKGKEE